MIPPRIKKACALDNFMIELIYENGEKKLYDMKKNLNYIAFKKLNDSNYFNRLKSAQTTVEWPDGEDVDPNDLYENSILVD